ncbi:MAG TPA: RNA polymerase sigma factor, partial [Planctomycetaceae bacterium]|nr:RNA polymerase sigma factor [Planctomycetaceae bacterium]
VSAWLFTVTRNKSISASRSRRRRVRHESRHAETHPCWFEESFETGLDAREISRLLDDLPGEQREILVMRVWGELTFEEIAELTSSSSSTCHRRYQEALEQLRKKVGLPCPNSNP